MVDKLIELELKVTKLEKKTNLQSISILILTVALLINAITFTWK